MWQEQIARFSIKVAKERLLVRYAHSVLCAFKYR